jgi:hypothetical protein
MVFFFINFYLLKKEAINFPGTNYSTSTDSGMEQEIGGVDAADGCWKGLNNEI